MDSSRPNRLRMSCASAKVIVAALLFVGTRDVTPQQRRHSQPFEQLPNCRLVPTPSNDGDSFLVELPDGRKMTFRLYFVDAPESTAAVRSRCDKQAAYFGVDEGTAISLGKQASKFTSTALEEPFTVFTRWRRVFGSARYYAVVIRADGQDLAQLLVSNGLARIYGVRTPLPDGRDSRSYLTELGNSETAAQTKHLGGWSEH